MMNVWRTWITAVVLGVGLAAGGCASPHPGKPEWDGGFVLSRAERLDGRGERTRALGPIVEYAEDGEDGSFVAVRPLFSALDGPGPERSSLHVLWPLFSSRRRGGERNWNMLLTAWGRQYDIGSEEAAFQYLLLPFLGYGRTRAGETYGGLFPIGGHMEDFLGRDDFDFVLFPLYLYTSKGDLRTWNVLFPIFSWSIGEDQWRYRIFPLYGRTEEPGVSRRFVLWPIWNQVRYSDPHTPGFGYMLFPLVSRVKMGEQNAWGVLPPFFRWSTSGEEWDLNAPWPIIQIQRGADVHQTYVWPFWGTRSRGNMESDFLLWPFFWRETLDRPRERVARHGLTPIYFHETRSTPEADGEWSLRARRVRVWPLASYRRDGEDMRFRMLELWPFAPADAVERLYAPFWSLYTRERSGGVTADELLWGLYRRTRGETFAHTSVFPLVSWGGSADNENVHWDFLKGFLGYEREGGARAFRFLYFLRWD